MIYSPFSELIYHSYHDSERNGSLENWLFNTIKMFSLHESRFGCCENSSRPQQDCAPCPEFRRLVAVMPPLRTRGFAKTSVLENPSFVQGPIRSWRAPSSSAPPSTVFHFIALSLLHVAACNSLEQCSFSHRREHRVYHVCVMLPTRSTDRSV